MGGTIKAYAWAWNLAKKEAAYGVQVADADIAAGSWLEIDDFAPAKVEKTYRTNANRINGARGKTLRQLKGRMGSIPRKSDASVEVITSLLGLGTGNVSSSGGGDPYTHTIKFPTLCGLKPPSTSIIEGIICAGLTSGYKLYRGVVVDQITIECGGGQDEVKLTYTLKHDGSETTKSSFSFPAAIAPLTSLIGAMVKLEIGLSGGSWTDITTRLLSWKVTVNFGPQPSKAANNSVYVSSYKYSNGNPHVDFDFTISGDKSSTEWGYSDADTLLQLRLTLDSGLTPARSVVMLMDQTYIIADEGSDDLEPTLVCKTDELDVVADTGPAIFTCKTGVAAYLVASP
jgi:hypothetical protein